MPKSNDLVVSSVSPPGRSWSRPKSASLKQIQHEQPEPWRQTSGFYTIPAQSFELPVPEPFPSKAAFSQSNEIKKCSKCRLEQQAKLLKLVPFSWVFVQMLLHTSFCALSSRWELRRMADQVFPSLIEVFSRFDFATLRKKWIHYLKPESSGFLKFTALLSLKHCLMTVYGFSQSEFKEMDQHQSKKVCEVSRYVEDLVTVLPDIMSLVLRAGHRSKYNRFRVLAADTIVSLIIQLDESGTVVQQTEQVEFVLTVLEEFSSTNSVSQLES